MIDRLPELYAGAPVARTVRRCPRSGQSVEAVPGLAGGQQLK